MASACRSSECPFWPDDLIFLFLFSMTDNSSNRPLHKAKFRAAKTDWKRPLDERCLRTTLSRIFTSSDVATPRQGAVYIVVSPRHKLSAQNGNFRCPGRPGLLEMSA